MEIGLKTNEEKEGWGKVFVCMVKGTKNDILVA
jgi:hypothetical protein